VLALVFAGPTDDAMASAAGVVRVAEETDNPYALSYALLAYGFAFRDADPEGALHAMRRGLVIARDSCIRTAEAYLALDVGRLEARLGDRAAALEHLMLALRIYHDSGSTTAIRSPLGILAATIAGFALSPLTALAFPEFTNTVGHLREVLGDATYESLADKGVAMSTAAIATYAYDQIDRARAEIEQSP
jgi:tetratricopeptide (TPR) repeat protein